MPTPSIEKLHSGLLALLVEHVDTEPVILAGRAGMGTEELATAALRITPGFLVDTLAAGGDGGLLAHTLTRQVVANALQPMPVEWLKEIGPEAERARVRLARYYDNEFASALRAAASPAETAAMGWTITRALGPSPGNKLLAVRDAHRLPSTVMWELRELTTTGIRLLLLTTPEHRARLYGREAPFYGMSAYIEMPALSLVNWQAAVGSQVSGEALGELLSVTRYRTAIALEILERHDDHHDKPIGFAFFKAVDARGEHAREILNLARSIHELAPRLILALAAGEPPYSIHAARSDRVALALRHLRDYGLVEQVRPRSWQIADPLLSVALRRLQEGESYVELYPPLGLNTR